MFGIISDSAVPVAIISGIFLFATQVATGILAYLANKNATATKRDAERAAYQTQPSNGVRLATIVEHLDKKLDTIWTDVRETRTELMRHVSDSEAH